MGTMKNDDNKTRENMMITAVITMNYEPENTNDGLSCFCATWFMIQELASDMYITVKIKNLTPQPTNNPTPTNKI